MKLQTLMIAILAGVLIVGCGNKEAATAESTGSTGGSTGASTPVDSNKEYTLKINLAKGDKIEYTSTMEMSADVSGVAPAMKAEMEKNGSEHKMTQTGDETSEVTDVKDGKFTITDTYANTKGEGTGMFKEQKATDRPPTTFEVDEHGVVTRGDDKDAPSMVLPDKPVKVGDTWEKEVQGTKVSAKLVGVEQINGKDALKVEYTGMKTPGFQLDGPLTAWIDPEKGYPVKFEAKVKMENQGVKITGSMKKEAKA